MNETTKKKIKNILIRSGRTFIQTFLTLVTVNTGEILYALFVSFITSILSILMSLVKEVPENIQMEAIKQMENLLKDTEEKDVELDSH